MPKAGGLDDVVQRFDADTSGYVRGSDEVVIAAIKMAQENRETLKTFADLDDGLGGLKVNLADMRNELQRFVSINREVIDVQKQMADAQDDMKSAFGNSNDILRMHADQMNDLYDRYGDFSVAATEATTAQHEIAQSFLEAMTHGEAHGSTLDSLASRYGVLGQALQDGNAIIDDQIEKMVTLRTEIVKTGEAVARGSVFAAPWGAAGAGPGVSYEGPGGAAAYTGDNSGALAIAAARKAVNDAQTATAGVVAAQAAGVAAALSNRRDAGSGVVDAAIASAMGGGGGGWAGLAKSMAADSSGDSGKNAATAWRPVGAFLGTWLPRAHYVLMAANELAATLGPAVIAGGMGALVGMQGGEQTIPRLQAIFATGEALGPSLGETQGQFMGLKTPTLQNAQDLATGAATEGIGALTNMVKAGAGDSFIQLGQNTVAMWSRMMAGITTEVQGGLGKQLGGIVSGGTGYLSQFGQIFGNLGHLFLNAAPNLPGVGGDYLSIMQGATKGLAATSGWLGPALGPILAAEAGGRLGTPLVGGVASLLGKLGGGVAGLGDTLGAAGAAGGLSVADAAAIAGETGIALSVGGEGGGLLSGLLGKGGVGLAKAGGKLGAVTAPELAVAAASAYMLGKGITYQDPYQQNANALMSQINNMGIPTAVPSIIGAMKGFSKVPYDTTSNKGLGGAVSYDLSNLFNTGRETFKPASGWGFHPGALATGAEAGISGFFHEVFGGTSGPTNYEVAQQKLQQLSDALVNTFGTGQQVNDQWKKLTGTSLDMGKAFDVATMAQLQLGTAFEKNGKLTAQAKQMISNFQAGYAPMNMNTGQFGAAVGAQTAMSGLQHTEIASVNQAYDQLTSLVQGGAAGAATFFGMLGGSPTTSTRGGIKTQAPPAFSGFAKALGSFTSAGGAAAWNTLTNTQTGIFPALESQTDWLREAQTMGSLNKNQTTSMAGFDIAQLLPIIGKNPAALAMLSTYAQQFGGPGFAPGTSGTTMQESLSKWVKQSGLTTAGYNKLMTTGTEGMANIGTDAQQFVQQVGSGVGGALAQGIANRGAELQDKFMNVVGHKGTTQALGSYDKFLAGSGVPLKGAQDMISYAAKLSGATPAQINAMMAQVKKDYDIYIKTQADASGVAKLKADMASIHDKIVKAEASVTGTPSVNALKTALATLQSKTVTAEAVAVGRPAIVALGNAIAALQSKTVYATTIVRTIVESTGTQISFQGVGSGNETASIQGSPLRLHAQTGYLVPGYGGGDIYPAMLEPGEAVIPKYLVHQIAPFLKAHGIPGFAAGGIVPGNSLASIDAQINTAWGTLDALYKKEDSSTGNMLASLKQQVSNFWKTVLDPLYAAKDALHGTTTSATNTATAAKAATTATDKLATTIANKFTTAMNFARGVSGAASAGQGFGTTGLISGMDPTQDTVANQMQAYLTSEKAFTKDLKTLTKGGLNKSLIQQLIAAGPTQGDALAQSILQGGGTSGTGAGISQVNQLWKQIGSASHALGSQAAMSVYGQTIAPNLKSGNVTSNNISINVSVPGGAGANLNLTTAQIKQITEEVQAALLKQAKRNRTTGVALAGKKA